MAATLSVVVPVYGTKRDLPACLESLRTQSLRDAEFLLVDDASPDGAGAVLAEYARRDSRFRVLTHSQNRGLFAARMTGADAATGKYLTFLDSDDFVSVDFYRAAVALAEENDFDLVMGDTVWQRENGDRFVRPVHADCVLEDELRGNAVRDSFFQQAMTCYSFHTIWNKVIRRDLWLRCAPYYAPLAKKHIVMTEDIAFSVVLYFFAQGFGRHRGDGVFYCEHASSSTGAAGNPAKFRKNYADIAQVFAFADEFLHQQGADQARQQLQKARKWYARMWAEQARKAANQPEISHLTAALCPDFSLDEDANLPEIFWFDQLMTPWRDGTERIKRAMLGLDGIDCPVISLDVFDTLILRPFRTPIDLFHTLEGKWQRAARRNMTSFAQARIEAESCARAWLPETQADVTMWNIYSAMMQNLGVSDDCVGQMTYNEREAEVHFCRPRKTGVQLFNLAKAAGKRVVLTSDMYLDADTIRRMLEKCGVRGWDGFFLSNEQNALKWNGALYRKMTAQLGVKPDHVLHIGDNAKIDVEAAKKAGLHALLLPRPADVFMDADCTQMANLGHGCLAGFTTADAMQPLALRCAQGLAANRFFDDGYAPATADSAFAAYPSRLGYYAVGTHLLALAKWLLCRCRADGVKRLVFLARDGALLRQAVELLRTDADAVETDYIPASRRCLLPALMANPTDWAALPVRWTVYTPEKTLKLLSFCTLDAPESELRHQAEAAGFPWQAPFQEKTRWESFLRFFRDKLYDGCRHQAAYSAARAYYEEKLPEGSACFDMGYSGRLQAALCQLTQRAIPVYYVHADGRNSERLSAAYDFPVHCFYPMPPAMSGAFREFLLSSDEAPCVGFERQNARVVPVYAQEGRNEAAHFLSTCVRHHALQFVRDFHDTFTGTGVMQSLDNPGVQLAMSLPFEGALRQLPEADAELLRNIPFEDVVFAGENALDLRTLVCDQSAEAALAAHEMGAADAPSRMIGFIPEQTGLVKRTIGFLLFDRETFRKKLRKRMKRMSNEQ